MLTNISTPQTSMPIAIIWTGKNRSETRYAPAIGSQGRLVRRVRGASTWVMGEVVPPRAPSPTPYAPAHVRMLRRHLGHALATARDLRPLGLHRSDEHRLRLVLVGADRLLLPALDDAGVGGRLRAGARSDGLRLVHR